MVNLLEQLCRFWELSAVSRLYISIIAEQSVHVSDANVKTDSTRELTSGVTVGRLSIAFTD